MKPGKVVLIDYGIGNIFNLAKAIKALSKEPIISRDPKEVLLAEKVILPGVGAFAAGMEQLKRLDLLDVLQELVRLGRPILGICLGMQLLLSASEETVGQENFNKVNGLEIPGLSFIPGRVVRFKNWLRNEAHNNSNDISNKRYKIPQIGWNEIIPNQVSNTKEKKTSTWDNTLLQNIPENSYMYFVHSYYVNLDSNYDCLAMTHYGQDVFCSVLQHNHIMGCQFHPELSGPVGLSILQNFMQYKPS